jgi:tripartite-type tricarboxylate transporter receptor subunit TctC
MNYRQILLAICIATCAAIPVRAADVWPSKPIRIIVPYTPGGLTDVLARLVAQKAEKALGQPIVVENKPGAGTAIGASYVATSAADGYTLLMSGTTTYTTNPILKKSLPYKTSDFVPVALVGRVPFVAVAHPSIPANNLKELVAYAKANPGKITFSTSGQGTSSHLVSAMFQSVTGTTMRDIPYKGSNPALLAVLSNEVVMTFDGVTNYVPHLQAGKLKGIALFGESRLPILSDLPTMVEEGYGDAVAMAWFGILAPSGTPRAVIERINSAVSKALLEPDVKKRLQESNAYVEPRSPEGYSELLKRESEVWSRIIEPLNLQLD